MELRINILIVHNRYQSNNIGGEDIVYDNELKSLQETLGKAHVFSYEVSNDQINKFKLLFNIWFSFRHYQKIKKIVIKHKIDLVHVHNFYPLLTPSVFKAAKKGGAKVVHTLHNYRLWCISGVFYLDNKGICERCVKPRWPWQGVVNRCYRNSFIQSVLAQASFLFYRLIGAFSYIDSFFVLTDFQRKKVIHLGIPEKKIYLKPNAFIKTKPFVHVNDKKGYIYVGRLEASKGILLILNAWLNLSDNFILTVVGGGELEPALRKKYMKKNIIFVGKCERSKTLSLISQSQYLLQPALWYETFGLTIIEAMSFGVPVIGFNIGTRSDFIKNEVNGFLCEPAKLQETIIKSYEFSDYLTLSREAKKTAIKYDSHLVMAKQIKLYRKILQEAVE